MKMPVYFVSHGGGPWPWISEWDAMYAKLHESLVEMPGQLPERPKAILMVSAHWISRDELQVMTNPQPSMFYDYYGFPEHTYKVQYSAPGSPALAQEVRGLLEKQGFKVSEDAERGFDHGAFVPLAVAFPEADIPVVQLSIEKHYDPDYHIRMGQALASLRDQGVLIIASGLSFHNMRMFNAQGTQPSRDFDAWLQETMTQSSPDVRAENLRQWEQAPAARICHQYEDHLIPLMVAVGAASDDPAVAVYHDQAALGAVTAASFKLG